MNGQVLAIPLLIPAIWNLYTTFKGISIFFDLPSHPSINPGQFFFGVVITFIVVGFVIGSWAIWSLPDYAPALLLKIASLMCIFIDVGASWIGTKRVISFDVDDPAKAVGLALVVAIVVLSKIGLSWALFERGPGG